MKPQKSGYTREMTGLFLFFWAIFLVLCLLTFDKNDPALNHVSSTQLVQNRAGLFGAYVAGFLNEWFGLCSFLWPLFFVCLGASCLVPRLVLGWRQWLGLLLLVLFILETSQAFSITAADFSPSGIIGYSLYGCTTRYLSPFGAFLVWIFFFLISLQLLFSLSWVETFLSLRSKVLALWRFLRELRVGKMPGSGLDGGPSRKERRVVVVLRTLWQGLLLVVGFVRHHLAKGKKGEDDIARLGAVRANAREANEEREKKSGKDGGKKKVKSSEKALEESDEPLFQPAEDIYKVSAVDEDILGLSKTKNKAKEAPQPDTEMSQGTSQELSQDEERARTEVSEQQAPEQSAPEESNPESPAAQKTSQKPEKPEKPEKSGATKSSGGFSPLKTLRSLMGKKTEEEPEEAASDVSSDLTCDFPLPPLSLLNDPAPSAHRDSAEELQGMAQVLIQTLQEFGIDGELTAITSGPVVTLFEVRPASGVRVNKFLGISDDMARVLKTPSVRVISPVPGKDTVGIEIPNHNREIVFFRELIENEAFRTAESPLTMALGKDTAGRPLFADLAQMPHMLIAGATGTGKSVCLNSILASFLYRAQPRDLRLLLIDPKRVEMSVYADEPHLIHPVVNEPADAKKALEWAINEMETRFKAMARLSVRNIKGFNKRLAAYGDNKPDNLADLEHLPYIAIIVDELADLMMASDVHKDIENSIVRLAQLARACGIHMILATQRPSVNIVTGIIKANFPCRISFQVAGSADSRTILDTVGAEKLLGRGDMLYKPGDTTIKRLHGAFLSDGEVCSLVEHWKAQAQPSYTVDFAKWTPEQSSSGGGNDASNDELYDEVRDFVMMEGSASISKIQRRFKIGFNRAARLVEALEAMGIVDPADGSKPRKVRSH